jgi:protein MpaA
LWATVETVTTLDEMLVSSRPRIEMREPRTAPQQLPVATAGVSNDARMRPSRAPRRWAAVAVAACAINGACIGTDHDAHALPHRHAARPPATTSSAPAPTTHPAPRLPSVTKVVLGRSVLGRSITAVHLVGIHATRRIVVFGCIHGDEPAGIAITRLLEQRAPPAGLELWVVDDLNPDGVAAGTRHNADGVDLNRNFPYAWQPIGHPGDTEYSGPRPRSEPESRIAFALLTRVRPDVTIWYHQHQGLVDDSGGDPAIEQRYAQLVGLPFERLTRYPGSATGWQNATLQPTTAFVVELGAGSLGPPAASRFADAVTQLSP